VSDLAVALPEPTSVVAEAQPLRETVLAGRFFGHRYSEETHRTAEFWDLQTAEAMATWFGIAAACRLAGDPEPQWPVWRVAHEPKALSADEVAARIEAIRRALGAPR